MINPAKPVKVSIFDEQYSFLSDEPEARIVQAALKVDSLMREVADKMAHPDLKKIAILLAVQAMSKQLALETILADDASKMKQLIETLDRAMSAILA